MSFFRSLLGVLPAAIVVIAVSGCPPPEPMRLESREARVLGIEREKAEDPVSGIMIWKSDAIKREYKGAIYYFESAANAAIFDRNPAAYAVVENVPPRDSSDLK